MKSGTFWKWRSRASEIGGLDATSVLLFRPERPARTPETAALETAALETTASRKKLTGSAKFIAGYVFLVSYGALRKGPLHFSSFPALRRDAIVVSGLVGSILLMNKHRLAKHAFMFWAFMIGLGITPWGGGPDADPLWFRILASFLATGLLVMIYREVDRNVTEDWERDEFAD